MVFSSPVFVFAFLPVVFLLCLAVKNIFAQNVLLLTASLVFYASGEPVFVLAIVFSVICNYVFARLVAAQGKTSLQKKLFCMLAIVFNLLFLGVFKYAGFFIESLNALAGLSLAVPQIKLPIGISFYTFQAISYVVDVYREPDLVQKKFYKTLLYISLFPQLVAGPIIKYHDIAKQIDKRAITLEGVSKGLIRFAAGLCKKVIIANITGSVADYAFSLGEGAIGMPLAWVGAIAYCLQIYYDFSAYSDMVIGLGHMFGFDFKENFDHPYTAPSIKIFWRKWHISLSTWFREYLYIPLGGNRKGKCRTGVNMTIVFLCTGLWHGAQWTFVVWGLWHGLFLLLENYKLIKPEKMGVFSHVYTLLVVLVGFVLFRAESFGGAYFMLKTMFTGLSQTPLMWINFYNALSPAFIAAALIGIVFSAPLLGRAKAWLKGRVNPSAYAACLCTGALLAFALSVVALSASTYNPFIYFRF